MENAEVPLAVPNFDFTEDDEPPSNSSNPKVFNINPFSKKIKFDIPERARTFLQKFYPSASLKDWNNWQWQLRNSITSYSKLAEIIDLDVDEVVNRIGKNNSLPLRITPYYASLLSKSNHEQALRKSIIPSFNELVVSHGEESDPLGEDHDNPVHNIVHRYPDRVLFLATKFCAAYCRYCTRSHMVAKDKKHFSTKIFQDGIDYIKAHPEVRDVLISGGDPLTMGDSQIEFLLRELRAIPHVEIIRIGTKVPAVLPQRITRQLVNILKKYHPLLMSLHFTHPDELTPESIAACALLADSGIPLGSQTVLLKGINDEVEIMKQLNHGLLKMRVRPYYLYQCDPILGSSHFRTSVQKGLEIIEGLRGHTSGYAVPHYVIDAPGGGGKIPLLPDYCQGKEDDNVVLRNFENKTYYYPDEVV